MQKITSSIRVDAPFFLGIGFLVLLSIIVLGSIAPFLFPLYFFYLILAFLVFFLLFQVDFEIISLFSKHFYIGSIVFLVLPILIGQITRGTIRWIPLGPLTIQPAEIVRPFLLVFFASYITSAELNLKRFIGAILLLALPAFLILVQPSLGVAVITVVGFVGVLLAADIKKKYFLYAILAFIALTPLFWRIMQPYQRERILTFVNPASDPYGAGYNALQSMISVGSGKITGRGLGRGV
ncbi:FtsW/RodA/SpoVE family cell cycle protein, partial [Candidatus Woesebacteria bacterium]|nr:FtsW/RodA/SpoVE family cell cycle protein [Candidatus Woesebacteria bacterium]